MQKHNKYLVVTIWIATIAFIGAGFVGWGTYQYGSKAGAIARVGEVSISQEKFNFTYRNLYRDVAQRMGGNFDDAKAKELGLARQAYNRLVMQAYLLNLAREYGIVVSEEELAKAIASIPGFQENGRFDKKIYLTFLNARGMKARTFEAILRDDLTIEKLMKYLNKASVPYEREVIASALGIEEKIRYAVLAPGDVNLSVNETELKRFWEEHKGEYLTPKKFKLSILWTDTSEINATESDLENFYRKNSFNYTDAQGKELGFEKAKEKVRKDYRIKKGKKKALLDYIALKKGKLQAQERVELAEKDAKLSPELWEAIGRSAPGTLIKPKPVGSRYAKVRLDEVIAPRPMTYAEAKEAVRRDWTAQAEKEALRRKAENLAKEPEKLTNESPYLSLTRPETLAPLNPFESSQFLQKLFTSKEKVGIISINKKMVVYRIIDQKFGENGGEMAKEIAGTADSIKRGEFERSLLKELSGKYPVQTFVKGF
jgi:peptidyl-prolyl cis-trans isomerase D